MFFLTPDQQCQSTEGTSACIISSSNTSVLVGREEDLKVALESSLSKVVFTANELN